MSVTVEGAVERVRLAIREMNAYTLEPNGAEDKLDQNELPFDWSHSFKEEVLARCAARSWNLYPDFEQTRVRGAIAACYGFESGQILVGNGSNDLLFATMATLVAPGTTVIVPRPSFALYEKLARVMGARVVSIAVDPLTGRLPVREMVDASLAGGTPSLVIACSPNNPTGGALVDGELDMLLESGATVLLDRAYGEFCDDELRVHPNLVTLSTFSKAWGLAALRLGWLLADERLVNEIRKVKLPYNLNVMTEEVAVTALERRDEMRDRVAVIVSERARVLRRMAEIGGVAPFPSRANFIAFRVADASTVFAGLLAQGVLVRDISAALPDSLRVSIGSSSQNDNFLRALTWIAEGASK